MKLLENLVLKKPCHALVVGYGSIGKRHVDILKQIGCSVSVVSRRGQSGIICFASVKEALSKASFDYVVVANETRSHYQTLLELEDQKFKGVVGIEKPLFEDLKPRKDFSFSELFVLYNFRFHPFLARLKQELFGKKVTSVNIYVGQYLPDWRPGRDYRSSYSAQQKNGGVLRDLSHEIDFLLWLFGPWKTVFACVGKYSSLEISSEDTCALIATTELSPVCLIELNYSDRIKRRELVVNTDGFTYHVDLVKGEFFKGGENGKEEVLEQVNIQDTYFAEQLALLERAGFVELGKDSCINPQALSTFKDGEEVVKFILAAERSARDGKLEQNQ